MSGVPPLPSTFRWLFAGALLSALATFVWPFVTLFLVARGLSAAAAGRIVALFGVGTLLSPVAGALSDRFGRRRVIVAALFGSASGAAALAVVDSRAGLAAAVLLYATSITGMQPVLQATVADVVPAESRPRALALLHWANNFGAGVSLLAGGLLVPLGWAVPFLADAATTLAFAALVLLRVPETRPPRAPQGPSRAAPRGGFAVVLSDRSFATLLALHAPFAAVFWQFLSAAPLDMIRHGLSPARFGLVLATNSAVIATLQPLVVRFTARRDPWRTLAAAALLVGVGYGAYGFASSAVGYALATATWTLGEIAYLPTAAALVQALAPAALRGSYAGAYALAFGAGSVAAPLVGLAVLDRFGSRPLWGGCLAVAALVAAGYARSGRQEPRRRGR